MRRSLSLFLVICISLTCMVFTPSVNAAGSATASGYDNMHGVHMHHESEIVKNPDGSFTLAVDIFSDYAVKSENINILTSENGYYTAEKPGRYLVELWGGDGATVNGAGKGGAGGYVYGIIELDVGDTLLYTLGSGGEVANVSGAGGGANGGGGYGENGSNTVGGGGGYSAMYLFSASEYDSFESKYLDSDGHLAKTVVEADRISKYILIAGGGGGGGSYGADNNGTADGGRGGYVGAVSGKLDASYDVAGTFFSGSNGSSTGNSTEYVGKGGSNTPGNVVKTMWGWGEAVQPNDWKMTYNSTLPGGAGGAGNYRGGSGGGGFCGGSGGVMSNVILANNVGGGGGGSSFISDVFTMTLDSKSDSKRIGDNKTAKGGEMHIVFLDEEDDSYLKDMTVSFARTPYFYLNDIVAVGKVWNKTTQTYDDVTYEVKYRYVEYDASIEVLEFYMEGVSLLPASGGEMGDQLRLTIGYTPKPDFAGGANVPLFKDDIIKCIPSDSSYKTGELSFKNACGYVNVPLNFDPAPMNHTPQGLDPENTIHPVSSLYIDKYSAVRADPDADWRYHFINSIGEHVVKDEDNQILDKSSTVSPDETTRYYVELEVVPKTPTGKIYATLGDAVVKKTFTGISVITVAGSGMDSLNDNVVVYNKSLYHNGGDQYTLSLNINSDSSGSISDYDKLPTFNSIEYGSASGSTSTVTVPVTGRYTVSLKGGNGGTGGSALILGTKKGAGGIGGSIEATFVLAAGTVLKFSTGANAADASATYTGAEGGGYSYVAVLDSAATANIKYYLMIAAGGGGGGAAYLWNPGGDGETSTAISHTMLSDISGYNGAKGGSNSAGSKGGSAADNYVYNGTSDENVSYVENSAKAITPQSAKGGTASLKCEGVGTGAGSVDELKGYTVETAISKYFTVEDVTYEVKTGTGKNIQWTTTDKTDHSMVSAMVSLDPAEMDSGIHKIEFTLNIVLKAKEGFLGGNDVPLVYQGNEEHPTGMTISQGQIKDVNDQPHTDRITVDEDRTKDYVNVAIPESFISGITLVTKDDTYVIGGAPVIKNTLIESLTGMPSLDGYGWEADYIEIVDPRNDTEQLTPGVTTEYTIEAGVGPKYKDPYATVAEPVENMTVKQIATVYTDAKVEFQLKGITVSGGISLSDNKDYIPFSPQGYPANDYTFELNIVAMEEEHHHHLPNEIKIMVGDTELVSGVDYEYVRDSDEHATVTVKKQSIVGNMTIVAEACHESYKIYYVFQNAPASSKYTETVFDRHFGEIIDLEADLASAGVTLPAMHPNYDFVWDWGDGSTVPLQTMPKKNVWVMGTFVPKEYTVTVNYVFEDGTKAADSVSEKIKYRQDYSIESPIINGYVADLTAVSGRVDGDVTHTVTYRSTAGELNILYIYKETGAEAATAYNATLEDGEAFSITSPTIVGYTADKTIVEGNMTSSGVTVYVYYQAKTPTVTFDAAGGTCSPENKLLKYGESYGYNAESGKYDGLPIPIKIGYDFDGWYLDGNLVDESMTVNTETDHELVARWKGAKYELEIRYVNENGEKLFDSVTYTLEFGEAYSYDTPFLRGHSPDPATVSGVLPAQNTIVTVIYSRLEYSVKVEFLYEDGRQAATPYEKVFKHGDSYSVSIPTVPGYTTGSDKTVEEGVVDAENIHITVYYYKKAPTVNVTVSWDAMIFTYEIGDWDPETHDYVAGTFVPVDGGNSVTVENSRSSKVSVIANLKFSANTAYTSVQGYFTLENLITAQRVTDVDVGIGTKKTAYLWLIGEVDEGAVPETFTVGTMTVTVRTGVQKADSISLDPVSYEVRANEERRALDGKL